MTDTNPQSPGTPGGAAPIQPGHLSPGAQPEDNQAGGGGKGREITPDIEENVGGRGGTGPGREGGEP